MFELNFHLIFVQTLFPGMWLSEITADSYKVPEAPENNGNKVCIRYLRGKKTEFWVVCILIHFIFNFYMFRLL